MEIRTLRYFLAVAQELNITRAAALLHLTQPTLSRQLMQLEDELGAPLFVRSKHAVRLTEHGELLVRRAREILALEEKARAEISRGETPSGTLAIGSGEYLGSRLLAQILAKFHERFPDVQFEFFSGNSDNIKERIERGILDMGFLLEPVDTDKYECIASPVSERWGVLVPENSRLAKRPFLSPEELSQCPLILSKRLTVRQKLARWFGEYADSLNIIATGNLPYNMASLCREFGGAFINLELHCNYPGLVFVPMRPELETHTVLAWKKSQPQSAAMQCLVRFIRAYISGMGCDKN